MRKYQTITRTALCLMMLMLAIFTSVAVAQAPTEISSIEDLNDIRDDLDGNYVLTKNLDFTENASYDATANKATYTPDNTDISMATNPGFPTIGNFTGTFDGGNFTISNLYINVTTNDVGLFGRTNTGSEVKNLGLEDVYVKGANQTGGLAGNNNNGTINNCYVTGTVTGGNRVGGLVGVNRSTINNCYATATVTGTAANQTGGLVGYNIGGTISNCYAAATVSGANFVGGLAGSNETSGIIRNSYATGNATGSSSAGGLVGFNSGGAISNCYATGNAIGRFGNAGGLLGSIGGNSTITNCYATGNASAEFGQGGFVGSAERSRITNCYATGTATGEDSGEFIGLDNGLLTITNGFGKTTTQLKALTGADIPGGVTPDATTIQSNWGELSWDFGDNTNFPTLRSYVASGDNQVQGFVFANSPLTMSHAGLPLLCWIPQLTLGE